jgi:hypothetical protein
MDATAGKADIIEILLGPRVSAVPKVAHRARRPVLLDGQMGIGKPDEFSCPWGRKASSPKEKVVA